jgi:hypothetical protein
VYLQLDGVAKSILDVPSLKVELEIAKVLPPANDFEFPEYLNNTKVDIQLKELVEVATETVIDKLIETIDNVTGGVKDTIGSII